MPINSKFTKPRTAGQKAWNAEIDRLLRYQKRHKVEVILPPKPKKVTQAKLSGLRTMRGVRIPTRIQTPQTVRRLPQVSVSTPQIKPPKSKSQFRRDTQKLHNIAILYSEQYGITVQTFLNQYKRYLPDGDYRKTGLPLDPEALKEYLNDLENGSVKTPPKKDKTEKSPQREIEETSEDTEKTPQPTDVTETTNEVDFDDLEELPSIYDEAIENFKDMYANYSTEAPSLVNTLDDIVDTMLGDLDPETFAILLSQIQTEVGDIDQYMYYGLGRAFDYLRKLSNLMRREGYNEVADSLDLEIERYEETDTINMELVNWRKGIGYRASEKDRGQSVYSRVWNRR